MATNPSSKFSDTNNRVYVQGNKTVTTTQTLLVAITVNEPDRQWVEIENKGDENVYIGPSGVTAGPSGTGMTLFPCSRRVIAIRDDLNIYGITLSGSSLVTVSELG